MLTLLGGRQRVVEAGPPPGRLVLRGVGADLRPLHAPRDAAGRLGTGLLGLELPGAQEPADERRRDAELGGGLVSREPLVLGPGRNVPVLGPRRVDGRAMRSSRAHFGTTMQRLWSRTAESWPSSIMLRTVPGETFRRSATSLTV